MKRKDVLEWIRIYGYHFDERSALRLYTENRVSYKAYRQAYDAGVRARYNGVPCSCRRCANEAKKEGI